MVFEARAVFQPNGFRKISLAHTICNHHVSLSLSASLSSQWCQCRVFNDSIEGCLLQLTEQNPGSLLSCSSERARSLFYLPSLILCATILANSHSFCKGCHCWLPPIVINVMLLLGSCIMVSICLSIIMLHNAVIAKISNSCYFLVTFNYQNLSFNVIFWFCSFLLLLLSICTITSIIMLIALFNCLS